MFFFAIMLIYVTIDCPSGASSNSYGASTSRSGGAQSGGCYNCGQEGHWTSSKMIEHFAFTVF
jgi:hypothetical protein